MSTSTTVPAGWYPDPAKRHEYRYWNGRTWTQNVSDHGVSEVEIPAPRAKPEETRAQAPTRPVTPAASTGTAAAAPAATPVTPTAAVATRTTTPPGPTYPSAPVAGSPGRPGRGGGSRILLLWGVALAAVLALLVGLLFWAPWAASVPDAPADVRATLHTGTSARVEWAEPGDGPTVERYLIRRDGDQVGSVAGTETSYVDRELTSASTYRYTVVAESAEGQSDPSDEVVFRTTAPAPARLVATVSTPRSVVLRWLPPSTGTPPDGYVVLRDDDVVGTVDGATTTFRDDGLTPGSRYAYSVAAVWGEESSETPATAQVRTQFPPLSSARLAGVWTVRTSIDKAAGGSVEVGDTFTDTWRMRPKCESGACDVVLSGTIGGSSYTQSGFRMTLERKGVSYTGSTTAHLTHCSTVGVKNDVSVQVTIKKAQLTGESWDASRWRGSITVHSPYTQASATTYCPDQSFGGSVTATR